MMKILQNARFKMLSIALFAVFAIGIGSIATSDSAFAATKTWTGATNSNFNTSGNWSPSGVPATGDDVVIVNSSGSTMSLTNDATLSLHSITLSGANPISIAPSTGSITLTLTGPITSTTGTTQPSTVSSDFVLGADSTVTNVILGATGDTLALASHTLTLITNSSLNTNVISVGAQITGAGVVTIDVRNSVSLYLKETNNYSGTTNLNSGAVSTLSSNTNSAFGTSSIIVAPSATLSLDASGASWSFTNPISFQPAVVGQSGFLGAQLYIWAHQASQAISVPNITLLGDARFDFNDASGAGSTANLAGIVANGHCVQYGDNNNAVGNFTNGPSACVIGSDANAPNTAVKFVTANPFLIIGLGIVTATFLIIAAIRYRSTK
jgi:hypothetical protein